MAHTFEGAESALASRATTEGAVAARKLSRSMVDKLVSWSGIVVAVALIALGAAAIYGGSFAQSNVRDRLAPQNISFPPASAMTPEEKAEGLTQFAGQKVDTGTEAEAFSRYIGGHLLAINDGKSYSETSSESRAYAAEVGESPTEAQAATMAENSGKTDTLFKGETLRSILLNAYGWWTVGTITFFAGIGMVIAGAVLALLAGLGFWHSRKTS